MSVTEPDPGTEAGTLTEPDTGTVTVRYFAAAKAATGSTEEQRPLPSGAVLGDLLADLRSAYGPELSTVLDRCSFLIDEVAAHGDDAPLRPGSVVDVLPPFAGG